MTTPCVTAPRVPFRQSPLSHASDRRFNLVSLLGTVYGTRLLNQPADKLSKDTSSPAFSLYEPFHQLLDVCSRLSPPPLRDISAPRQKKLQLHFHSWFPTGEDKELFAQIAFPLAFTVAAVGCLSNKSEQKIRGRNQNGREEAGSYCH